MSDCIFCKIINGDIPSYTVYEDDRFKAILDVNPSGPGHCLILPKGHCENIYGLSEEDAAELTGVIQKVARALDASFDMDGLNILQNNGEAAGQTVFHLHVHLIPRYKNDGIKVGWKAVKQTEEGFTNTLNKIKSNLN